MFIKKNRFQAFFIFIVLLFSLSFRLPNQVNEVVAAPLAQALAPRTVRIDLIADSWVQVIVDGEVLLEGLLRSGASREWSGQDVFLKIGNAGGVEVTVDGELLGFLGGGGQVVSQRWVAEAPLLSPTVEQSATSTPSSSPSVLASPSATATLRAEPTATASPAATATAEPAATATVLASATTSPTAIPSSTVELIATVPPIATLAPTVAAPASPTAAETGLEEESLWSEPINISNSGAASSPLLLASQAGGWQVFWMDKFDGLMMTRRSAGKWQAPQAIPLFIDRTMPSGEITRIPVSVRPDLLVDERGTTHALWLGTPEEREERTDSLDVSLSIQNEDRPPALFYSQLTPGASAWSEAIPVGEAGLAWDLVQDAAGRLQLIYLRPSKDDSLPAGVYSYRRTPTGPVSWSGGQLLYQNLYFRLLSLEDAHVQAVASDEALFIHVVWDNPRFNESYYVRSTDGGDSWSQPEKINDQLQAGTQKIQVAVTKSGEVLRLWESKEDGVLCSFYQQRSTDRGTTWDEPKEILTDLTRCPASWRFLSTEDGRVLWVADEGSATLQLAAWNGESWSKSKRLEFRFDQIVNGQSLSLISLQLGLLGDFLALVGQGQNGEIWYVESQLSAFEFANLPPSPWIDPLKLSQSIASPRLPAITSDSQGQVHMLWSEAPSADSPPTALIYARWNQSQWIRQGQVLDSGDGSAFNRADEPDLVAVGDRLHAVWSGGSTGEVLYGRVDIAETATTAWSPPQRLPAPAFVGCCPVIKADGQGSLHVIYAIPLNEKRGIYYTRSDNGGQSWQDERLIFDAVDANWARVNRPRLAIDESGVIHVVWLRAGLPGGVASEGIYYSKSTDGGQSWQEAEALVMGSYEWAELATTSEGQVHLIWQTPQTGEYQEWQHLYSTRQGQEWSVPERMPVLLGVTPPLSLNSDQTGNLYLMGSALIYGAYATPQYHLRSALWTGESWTKRDSYELNLKATKMGSGLVAALEPISGKIHIAFRGKTEQSGITQEDIWTTNRAYEVIESNNGPLVTNVPVAAASASSPTPQATMTITPTAPPVVSNERAEAGIDQSSSLIFSGLLALLVVGLVFVVQLIKKR